MKGFGKSEIKKMALDGILAALALIIFVVELQIPSPVPIPGVKLGLANIISLVAVFELGPAHGFMILLIRILLGSIFSGRVITLLYSLSGGLLCFLVTLLMRRILTRDQIWVASVFGAIAHNIGQMAAAVLVTATPELLSYLPVLLMSGVITGLFTGIAATALSKRLKGIFGRFQDEP